MTALHFHQRVTTPAGPGIVQGEDERGGIIISHRPAEIDPAKLPDGTIGGRVWYLASYPAEAVTP